MHPLEAQMRDSHRKKIFIIHGWSYNLDKWQSLLPELEKRGIEPVMLKVPGLTEPSDKVWDIGGYIEWLDSKLNGESNPIVVGHSNGGRIALAYIQKHPGVISRLILIDSAGLANSSPYRTFKLKVLYVISKLAGPIKKLPLLRRIFYKLIGAKDYYSAPPNMRETMQNMLNADNTIDLGKISLPVTLIWGRDDTITPLKDGLKMHKLLAGSEMHIIDDARHAPQDAKPEEVADIIARTLGQADGSL
jgi:pimeloyl-ACP methyl ester carboxylesterase